MKIFEILDQFKMVRCLEGKNLIKITEDELIMEKNNETIRISRKEFDDVKTTSWKEMFESWDFEVEIGE